jgi:MFS family permease
MSTVSPTPRFPALRHRDFRTLWVGMLFASGTMAFQYYAQIWLVFSLTDSALVLGVLGATRGVAMLVFGLYGGALADRMDRRQLLMCTGAVTLLVNLTLGVLGVTGAVALWQALVLIFLGAATAAIDTSARQALIPELVSREDIPNATALTMAAQMGTFALTPALAGFVIDTLGPGGAYALSVIGNAGVLVALALLRYRGRSAGARRQSALRDIREGARYLRSNRTALRVTLIMLAMGALGSAIFNGLIAKWASDVLHVTPGRYGLVASMWGTGALTMSYWLASTGALKHKGRIFAVTSVGFGLTFTAFGLARWLPLVGLSYLANGMMMAGSNVTSAAILQSTVPNEVRGRVMSLYGLNQSAAQLNGVTLGAASEIFGIEVLVPAATMLCTIIVVSLLLTARGLWRSDSLSTTPSIDARPRAVSTPAPPGGS